MSNSEYLKKMREALSDYYELARKLRDDEIREAGYAEDEHEGMLRAEEAIHLFDAHIAALSQQEPAAFKEARDSFYGAWKASYAHPQPQKVESKVPQSVEEFIKSNGFEVSHTSGVLITAPDFLDFMAGKALVPVERITTVARDVEYSPHTNRHTPFLRINFAYDDYDSRDKVYAMLTASNEEQQ